MKGQNNRDSFTDGTKAILAKRAGFLCSICKAMTVGPSKESPYSVTNIGVAAHISGASPGGPRYNPSIRTSDRVDIRNGIWLCQNDAKLIDCDSASWTVHRLLAVKEEHEQYVAEKIMQHHILRSDPLLNNIANTIEYAFLRVREIEVESYKKIITPILHDKNLDDNSELGLLMLSSPDWTVFVNADWLRWRLTAQQNGYAVPEKVPPDLVYGKIPAWPDKHLEFLAAIVMTNTTFEWHRHPEGYLVLAQ